jgi:FKBP-type peptidyl-prolyl cis-trans isomerase FkpA
MSAVTAVPLRPLARGSVLKLWLVLALLVAAAAGLAWWDTGRLQPVTLDNGVQIRTLRQGTGPAMTSADVVAMRFVIRVNSPDAPVFRDSGREPFVGTVQDLPAGFAEAVQRMRARGLYLVTVPVSVVMAGQPVPPQAAFTANDNLLFETQVLQIEAGQASAFQMGRIRQMMEQQQLQQQGGARLPGAGPQGAGPGRPGSAPGSAPPPPAAGGR